MSRKSPASSTPVRSLAVLALAGLMLTGCGTSGLTSARTLRGTAASAPAPVVPPAEVPSYPGQPMMAGGNPQGPALAASVVAEVARTRISCKTWTAKAYTEVVSPTGDKNWNVSDMRFKAPSTMSAMVVQAKSDKVLNTKLVYHGGSDVDVRTYFFGFIAIKLTLPVDDSRLVDCYKRSLRDTQTSQLMDMILNPQARATYLGTGTVKGETVDLVDIVSPGSWKDVSHEIVGVSRRLGVPLSRETFDKHNHRIFHLELENFKFNAPVGGTDFTLD